jgi:hypothetical protein
MEVRMSASLSNTRFRFAPLSGLVLSFAMGAQAAPVECPQPRFTGKAPDEYYTRVNPLGSANSSTRLAEAIFQGDAGSANCALCHGKRGNGKGPLSGQYDPPPRNFACAQTINGVPDGQLFWIIRYGSPGTGMPPHSSLKDDEVWQLVSYLRQLAK